MLTLKRFVAGGLVLCGVLLAIPGWAQELEEESPAVLLPGKLLVERLFRLPDSEAAGLRRSPAPVDGSAYWSVEGGQARQKEVLLSENFEGAFPGSTWTTLALGASDVTWGRSTHRSSNGAASVWAAESGSDAPGAGGDVPTNATSWMIAGPYDLSSFASGSLAFDLWLETEPSFDFFFVGASINGTDFTALGNDTNTSGWERFSVDLTSWGSLGNLTGRPQVWFSFIYQTDGSVVREGAYVDNVILDTDATGGLNLVVNQVDTDACPSLRAIVSVTDAQGNPVQGLNEQNFTLSEDGTTRTITAETAGTGGDSLAVSLVLDGSGSLSDTDVMNAQVASNLFIDLLAPADRIAVYHFGSDVERVQDYTTNRAAARAAVNALTDNLGLTSLYDAIVDAANHSTTVSGRRALIVMTDGRNNDSQNSLQDAIDAARAAGVPVFTIGFGSADEVVLQTIAQETGGLFFQGATSGDLQMIFNLVGQTLNNQYILTWVTTQVDGAVHDITVEVQSQGQSDSQTVTYSQANTPCANVTPCVPGPRTMCLNQGRFRVEAEWRNFDGDTGPGQVASCGADDSGIFWFFAPDNWEMLIKVLSGCAFNDRYWVFFAATTNVEYTLTVTDTQNGLQKVYTNPLGTASPAITDVDAFATCP